MSFFGFFSKSDVNEGVNEFKNVSGAVLLDVRTRDEYACGHIENSINVPLDALHAVVSKIKNRNTPVFVYCYSGARSGQATTLLKRMGYTDVRNIGGIASYRGKVVR